MLQVLDPDIFSILFDLNYVDSQVIREIEKMTHDNDYYLRK